MSISEFVEVIKIDREALAASDALELLVDQSEPSSEPVVKFVRIYQDAKAKNASAHFAHDRANAFRSLQFLVELLEDGYRFDDALAAEKIQYIKKAVAVLERDEAFLKNLLEP